MYNKTTLNQRRGSTKSQSNSNSYAYKSQFNRIHQKRSSTQYNNQLDYYLIPYERYKDLRDVNVNITQNQYQKIEKQKNKENIPTCQNLSLEGINKIINQLTQKISKVQTSLSLIQQREKSYIKDSEIEKLVTLIKHSKQVNEQFTQTINNQLENHQKQLTKCKQYLTMCLSRKQFNDIFQKIQTKFSQKIVIHKSQQKNKIDNLENQINKILQEQQSTKIILKNLQKSVIKIENDKILKLAKNRNLKCNDSMLSFIYEAKLTKIKNHNLKEQQKEIIHQWLYYVDKNGYLLDSEKRYLLNKQGEQIKISENQLQLLREKGFLS